MKGSAINRRLRQSSSFMLPQLQTVLQMAFQGHKGGYILDPHSAIGVAASLRSIKRAPGAHHISLATAHPAKFANAVDLALKDEPGFSFDTVLPEEFVGLEKKEKRVLTVPKGAGWEGVRTIVEDEVEKELKGSR